ncbi:DUF4132 domain-containing protein [Hyunsoonleella flava]|uniref:DUF4132 domain-containing protein n=2 Tax=Pseudomonadati TaxID=3379134 RepID=A0A4Q9FI72_9FLAO|nr:DUF4132 domain-containing protein [Hyunsoonleella flava]TBN06691.1 DUF4132 domain-containing protein [Hyunsoonleella flava]
MIKLENAQAFIESKKTSKLQRSHLNGFSRKYNVLGLLITQLSKNTTHSYYSNNVNITPYKDHFGSDVTTNPWKSKEGAKLAKLLFGNYQAKYISDIWDLILKSPYQNDYTRRSFRCKSTDDYTVNRLRFLQNLYQSGTLGYSGLNILELAQYDIYDQYYYKNHSYVFAAALNDEKESVNLHNLIKDIFLGEDEIGGVTRGLIKGLLLTENPENWKLVEDLLLAAQRQEGLRQTILEALDETSIGALQHFIKVILDYNLMRFSSVVRAVDTWFGFGWEAPKTATIKRVLELSLSFFEKPSLTERALTSKDNLEIYVALWFLGLDDVDNANLKAIDLINTGSKEKKILASMFISQTGRTNHKVLDWINSNFGNDLEIDFWVLQTIPINPKLSDDLFNKIKHYGEELPSKGKIVKGQVFAWTAYTIKPDYFFEYLVNHANKDQYQLLAKNLSAITSDERSNFIRKLFPDHYSWSYYNTNKTKNPKINLKAAPWKRDVIHQAIKDRNTSVMATGINLFESIDLNDDDVIVLEDLLQRKNKDLREHIIKLILKQKENRVEAITSNLIASPKVDQRLAALEIMTVLHDSNRMVPFIDTQISLYTKRPKLTKNEQVYIDKFSKTTQDYSFENGFGAIDYSNLEPLITPKIIFGKDKSLLSNIISKITPKTNFIFGNLIDTEKTVNAINTLIRLFEKHQNYEYEAHYQNGAKETVLLSNSINFTDKKAYHLEDAKAQLQLLPMAEVWINWYENSKLNDFELLAAIYNCDNFPYLFKSEDYVHFVKHYMPNLKGLRLVKTNRWDSINKKVARLLDFIYKAYADFPTLLQFKIDLFEDAIARIPEDLKRKTSKERWNNKVTHWTDIIEYQTLDLNALGTELHQISNNTKLLKRYWDLKMYLFAAKLTYPKVPTDISEIAKTNVSILQPNFPPEWITVALYKANTISADDFKYQLLVNTDLLNIIEKTRYYRHNDVNIDGIPHDIAHDLKKNMISVELERGDLATEATHYMNHFGSVEGTTYLFELLTRLGKDTFHRGYSWYNFDSKKEVFSNLIKKSIPKETETYTDFLTQAKTSKITKKRWIETAIYAPQWANWIGEYLNIEKLEDAVWWFHAHASDYMNAEKETIISRYSNVEKADFAKGVIDLDWFNEVYPKFGKQNWKVLHDAAKYISDGNGHRLVKLYSSVILGEIKIRETLAKINDKRDKDYVKAFGLIPLSKANRKKDLLNRYTILQEFLRESKQFGAQRQESEKNAVEIALDNLARNAGYDDSIRFSWAMEGEATQNIMKQAFVEIDNVVVELFVNAQGKADIKVTKDGKSQKSIPAKYRKDKQIKSLQKNKAYLRKQYSRTRISLENAMLREEVFSKEELKNILIHPVVKAMLNKLVLYNKTKNTFGFYKEGGLEDSEGKLISIAEDDAVVIAHPSHLYENVVWDLYQKYAFDTKLVQPFKQIFRELYVITKDEIERNLQSERYQGHQIQPQKTVALLRSRGWTVNHEEGLQKVYHKKGFIASIYAMADWFSPADIEAPTLEHIAFHSRNTYKPIPLTDIDSVTFSEVMRDLDLVVSVAHVGGVDPEASHSTMQMRGALARETARLFKADNVTVQERHILIKGTLADYSIHLGSGMVSKTGLQLSIIPVHSQHRGRLFLPFIDDDPKTAEIISKMKLLSEDNKIKDPTILAQIQRS